ncbi:MAG: YkvA family protein [Bacillota bacterium]
MSKFQKLKSLVKNIKLAYSYIKDPNVSIFNKGLVVVPLIYIISPVDLINDYLLGIGWLDDTLIALLMWGYLLKKLEKYKSKSDNKEQKSEADYDFDENEYDIK